MDMIDAIRKTRDIVNNPRVFINRHKWFVNGDNSGFITNQSIDHNKYADVPIVDVFDIQELVVLETRKEIEVYIPSAEVSIQEGVSAYVMPYRHVARIMISRSTTCWHRFTLVKELMHVLLGIPENEPFVDVGTLIDNADKCHEEFVKPSLTHEEAAFYMAMEVMLPLQSRAMIYEIAAKEGVDPNDASYEIAERLMVPQYVVEVFLGTAKPASPNGRNGEMLQADLGGTSLQSVRDRILESRNCGLAINEIAKKESISPFIVMRYLDSESRDKPPAYCECSDIIHGVIAK